MNNTSAFKKKLDLIGKRKVKNILLVQPIQISEKKLDINIIKEEVGNLVGTHEYYPPKFSAKKIDGKRFQKSRY